ncbi:MAG: SufD family Fe-S cluster assembly protein [Phycisphaerae bacterium]|nr:SufD family Fe-S cluster assembly protein [Phycisphaerae bacterium]
MTDEQPARQLADIASIHAAVGDEDTAHLLIGLNEVVSSRAVAGLDVDVESHDEGVRLRIVVADGAVIAKPVHMCFGLLQQAGIQRIDLDFAVGSGAKIDVIAHCVFPNATDIQHLMNADIRIGAGARYSYFERHIHSDAGGLLVVPKAKVTLAEDARFRTDFELVEGRVGTLKIDYETTCGPRSVLEMTAKVAGRGDDKIDIRETGHLTGEDARGALTSRVAVRDDARADVYNKLTATAAGARGHVDCKEIITDRGIANAVPIVEVSHPKAHVTHEAALGSVDSKQLQTLMARGLTEDAAGDLIIAGLLS